MVAPWMGQGEAVPVMAMELTQVGWGHRGGIPCDSPQEQTLIALQYHLFSVQIVLAQVFLLWCLHYWVQQQFNVFFTFLPCILEISEYIIQ